ncbi:MAG: AtpZ/AtpI family protein [bacterium]|nr:AtpZ/AtpI family protein [bacterium]
MKESGKPNQAAWWQPAILMFAKLSAWIAVPIIIALYLGKWLDQKYDSAPWLLLALIGAAFVISMAGLVKEAAAEYRKIDKLGGAGKSGRKK